MVEIDGEPVVFWECECCGGKGSALKRQVGVSMFRHLDLYCPQRDEFLKEPFWLHSDGGYWCKWSTISQGWVSFAPYALGTLAS